MSGRVADLEAAVRSLLPSHMGACCTFDAANKVVVTEQSCRCDAPVHRARALVGEWVDSGSQKAGAR